MTHGDQICQLCQPINVLFHYFTSAAILASTCHPAIVTCLLFSVAMAMVSLNVMTPEVEPLFCPLCESVKESRREVHPCQWKTGSTYVMFWWKFACRSCHQQQKVLTDRALYHWRRADWCFHTLSRNGMALDLLQHVTGISLSVKTYTINAVKTFRTCHLATVQWPSPRRWCSCRSQELQTISMTWATVRGADGMKAMLGCYSFAVITGVFMLLSSLLGMCC